MTKNKKNIGDYWLNTKGYWKDKKRDANTIKKLSESKFIKIAQYDASGKLIKIWNSAKEIAIKIFDDYEIVDGGSKSQIYSILKCKIIDNKFHFNSYWFKVSELKKKYNEIPPKLDIDKIRNDERRIRGKANKGVLRKKTHIKKYSVLHYDYNGKLINKYRSSKHAAYELKITQKVVERICNGRTKNPVYNLKYGAKTIQPVEETYPDYEIVKPIKPAKIRAKTRTKYTVIQLDEFGNKMCVYDSVEDAANKLKIKEAIVRKLCLNKKNFFIYEGKKISLKYGEKIQKTL
ncbi:MAG: NUMOD1 domain-containing DNA-binding protein [bacterium]